MNMDPLFSSFSNTVTNNADDITASLNNNIAAINLNVGLQSARNKKTAKNDLFGLSKPVESENYITNSTPRLPRFIKNATVIQEFIPRNKVNDGLTKTLDAKIPVKNKLINDENKPVSHSAFQDLAVASVPEFIPRYSKNTNEPEMVEILDSESPALSGNLLNSPYDESNVAVNGEIAPSNIATYQENVNGTVYFYTAPLAQNDDTSPVDGLTASQTLIPDPAEVPLISGSTVVTPDGVTPILTQSIITDPTGPVYYLQDGLNSDVLLMQQTSELYTELPEKVGENYCNIEPLEALPGIPSTVLKGCITSCYKASHVKSGVNYFLRRIHNVSLPSTKCNALVNNWKKLSHTNLVHLKEMIISRDFGDNSLVFVYDYYPESETLLARHFSSQMEGLNDTFSSDPNAPRPYSHTKNALLRQQHSNSMLPESTLWSYAIQLTGALKVIHAAGLACRCLDPSKVIITNRNRVRLSGVCVLDVLLYDHSPTNRIQMTPHFQQDDLLELGKLLLALACGSLIAIQKENLHTSMEVMSRTYSTDIRNLIAYLLHTSQRRSVLELMPMIGARFYSQIDAMQLQCDILESEMRKESNYGRLLKLVIKLACINEWPDLNADQPWAQTSDRGMLTLLRDYLYHQMSEDQRPWIDVNQIIHSLTKLLDGSSEKVCLISRNEESVLFMSYEELKQCFERSYQELSEVAAYVTDETNEKGQNNLDM